MKKTPDVQELMTRAEQQAERLLTDIRSMRTATGHDLADLATLEVTDAQLAALASVTPRRIRQLAEAGAITRVGRNRYGLADAFRGLVEELSGGERAGDLTFERIRKTRADAVALAKAKQLVAPIAEMEKQWETFCVILRTNLRLIPQRVAPGIIGLTDER